MRALDARPTQSDKRRMAEKKNEDIDVEAAWISRLAEILHDKGLTEIEIEKGDVRLRVSRATQTIAAAAAPVAAPAAPSAAPPPAKGAKNADAVTSPMVGTAYLKPSPDAPTFVKVGDRVSEGQTLMIIEAMKTMNPIASPRAGVVKEVFVKDAQPVEFGEPLMAVE
ncbi:MAG: acetyl-CoA carboxylase biotin carboxyl carrier protein [Parvularculaceae bacterium]|nr:acetyl-CoA carboxylase biotin carboxyl carrier protein [Parvularculaceae bacterium]